MKIDEDYFKRLCLLQSFCLTDIDKTATARVKNIVDKLANAENINEDLKQCKQLEWVRCMNNIKNRAEEIVFNELIYVQEEMENEFQRSK